LWLVFPGREKEKTNLATKVRFAIPERQIEQTGITFKRTTDNGLHGELTIRQNHIAWRPKGNEYVFEVSWKNFAKFAEDRGKRVLPKATVVKAKKKLKLRD
jgi:hypothetical protein